MARYSNLTVYRVRLILLLFSVIINIPLSDKHVGMN